VSVSYKVTPNFAILGKKYKKDMAAIQSALKVLDAASLDVFLSHLACQPTEAHQRESAPLEDDASVTLAVTTPAGTFALTPDEVSVTRVVVDPPAGHCVTMIQPPTGMSTIMDPILLQSLRPAILLLDMTSDSHLEIEGLARTLLNRVQRLRKKCNLHATDLIDMYYSLPLAPSATLAPSSSLLDSSSDMTLSCDAVAVAIARFHAALKDHAALFYRTLRTTIVPEDLTCQAAPKHRIIAREAFDLDGLQVILTFVRPQDSS
jgi:Domain of unknown function (DUF5915)